MTEDKDFNLIEKIKEEREILKVPVKKRTEGEHRVLIKRFGGVRQYLLSMGDFKDLPKEKRTNQKIDALAGEDLK